MSAFDNGAPFVNVPNSPIDELSHPPSNSGNLNFGTLSPRLLLEDTFAIKTTPPRQKEISVQAHQNKASTVHQLPSFLFVML